jgi:hypothetical protein
MTDHDSQRTVLVCSACLRASCWQGLFPCEDAKDAEVTTKSIAELELLLREHPDFWR